MTEKSWPEQHHDIDTKDNDTVKFLYVDIDNELITYHITENSRT